MVVVSHTAMLSIYSRLSSIEDFIDADNEDWGVTLPPRVIAPVSVWSAGPSTFEHAVSAIADWYAHNPDRQTGPHHDDEGSAEETAEASSLTLLDPIRIWGSIREWMFDDLSYEILLDRIDFQYDHNPKIQYWEDFLSSLTFQADLDKQEELFMLIPLAKHLHRVSNYWSRVTNPSDSPHASPSPADVLPPPDGMEKMWIISIVPRTFLHNAYHDEIFTNLKLRCISKIYCPGLDSGWPHGHAPSTSPWPCHCMRYGPLNLPPCGSALRHGFLHRIHNGGNNRDRVRWCSRPNFLRTVWMSWGICP